MAKTAITAKAYDIHSHNWKVVRPIKTLQKFGITSPTLGMLNSCAASCHRNPSTAAGTGNVPNLGVGYDSTLSNWNEPTDSALADTLNRWFNRQPFGIKQISSEIPERFGLGQNYPNPFNPSTHVKFYVPKTALVSVRIYDILGREVYKLVDEKLTPGTYTVNWNSINNDGDYVASGVYFYQMTAGDFTATKKMILLR